MHAKAPICFNFLIIICTCSVDDLERVSKLKSVSKYENFSRKYSDTNVEVYNVLAVLDENKATGHDKIPAKLLKNCASSIYSSLCDFFNSLSLFLLLLLLQHLYTR